MTGDTKVWGIHGGRTGDANSLFLESNVVALKWQAMGDLMQIAASRAAIKERLGDVYPGYKPTAIPGAAGQLFRFVHQLKVGDLVCVDGRVGPRETGRRRTWPA